jgi:hypothetical protein
MYNTEDTQTELDLLGKALDDLNQQLNDVVGDGVIAKGDDGDISDADVAALEAEIDGLSDELDGELNKAATRTWDERVAKIAADENVPLHIASQRCRQMYPQEYAAYNNAGVNIAKAAAAAQRPPARTTSPFMTLARQLQMAKNLSGMEALQQARKSDPAAFEQYRNGK